MERAKRLMAETERSARDWEGNQCRMLIYISVIEKREGCNKYLVSTCLLQFLTLPLMQVLNSPDLEAR